MKEPIVSVSGVRGIFGESLTPLHVINYVSAFSRFADKGRIVIGRDGRIGGDVIEDLVQSTLLFCGCEVINLGIAPTPTVSLAVKTLKASGGISITASHNPQEWNGLKFMNSEGIFLDRSENKRLVKLLNKKDNYVLPYNIKQVEYYPGFLNYHIRKVLNLRSVNTKAIKARKFKIVVDCVNASGSVIIPSLLRELGCEVIEINCDVSGIFGRKPEPLPENLNTVSSEVKKRKADMGIVVDPDADRLVIITDEGKPFGEENTITTAVRRIMKLSRKKKTAVVNLSTSRSVDDIVKAYGGRLFKSPVGEVNVIRKMKEVDAVIGGEGSGGVILPELHYARDSLAGIGLLLSEFAEFDGKVSDYKRTLPEYYIKKSVLKLDGSKLRSVFSFLIKKYRKYPKNDEDGLRIDFPDGWVNFRKSNTEPVIRIIVETKSRIKSEELSKIFLKELMSLK